ncbi:hypothetical protein F2P56_032789 [Juglans regia]|uniref:Reverse transcriptase domain-containing protein n=2 Tax=Juglans regia TaxID=51240 RepID=A0A833WX24_JUGRE|nr:uncharacterized protein LOC108990305 [Juglans regia]KAF5447221.1 hypothetical protein F2P56_032789 [Juglans regia]
METKCGRKRVEEVRNKLDFDSSFVVDSKGFSGGLAFLWNSTIDSTLESFSQHHISMSLIHESSAKGVLFSGFYGSPIIANRPDSWKLLRMMRPKIEQAWFCFGDFNEILHKHEKYGAACQPYQQMELFRATVDFCNLSDLGFVGPKFTWCNNKEGAQFTKERLDRVFGNLLGTEFFVHCSIQALVAQTLDHSPILMSLQSVGRVLHHEGRGREKLFRFEASWNLQEECSSLIHSSWKSTQSKLNQLSSLQNSNKGSNNKEIKNLQKDIDRLLEEENVKWQQRAKQNWLRDGDRNSKFFHRCANQRSKTNEISKLVLDDGRIINDMEGIAEAFCQHYMALFSSFNPCGLEACLSHIQPSVTEAMNNNLSSPFTLEEVNEALFQMNPLGSPGPDGFSAIFYQSHWGVVGGDVTKAVLEVLNHGGDLGSINDTFIVLIPKLKSPQTVLDFRPISLCNVLYKIVSKVLSNRLKSILPQIISPTQSAFVPGRMILDNVIVAFEALHSMSTKWKGQQGYMAVKLDMSYDEDGFQSEVDLSDYEVYINRLLGLYENASGQQLNKSKTSIFFNANTRQVPRDHILGITGTQSTSCYETYLGLPVLIGRSRHAAFKGILDRMRNKINNWKTKFLSLAGKEILLKAVLQALPTYCMGVFKLPKSLLHEINRVMQQFWWGHMHNEKKVHWVSWGQMGKEKGEGGLGFRDFESFNMALLAKLGWRLIQFPDSLAAKVLKVKYFSTSDFLQAKVGAKPFFIWRSLCATRELIKKGSIWRIGNGQDTKIWNCRWLPRPSSYMVQTPIQVLNAEARVVELINEETKQWNRGLVVFVLGNEAAEVVHKIPISVTRARDRLIWMGTKDGQFTVKSAYHKQKELRELHKGQTSHRAKRFKDWTGFWKLQIPNVTKIFMWRACLESLPTRLNLYKKKIVDSPLCPICCREEESATHALWSCSSAIDVWSHGPKVLQKCSNSVGCFKDLVEQFFSSIDQTLMELFSMTARGIWLRRNNMVFENSFMQPMQVARQAAIHLTDFKAVQFGSKREIEQSQDHLSVWVPPPVNFNKINWDATLSVTHNKIRIGLVARDHEGSIVATKKLSKPGVLDPLLPKALGGLYAAGDHPKN